MTLTQLEICAAMARIDNPADDDERDYDPRPSGPFLSFHDWYMLQDAAMQARVKVVFPSLKVRLEKP
jgi:hypothetical protein